MLHDSSRCYSRADWVAFGPIDPIRLLGPLQAVEDPAASHSAKVGRGDATLADSMRDSAVAAAGPVGEAVLRLARTDRAAARSQLAALSRAAQASACIALDAAARGEFLTLLDEPEKVVPLLPETEFALTIRAQVQGGIDQGRFATTGYTGNAGH